IKDGRVEQSNFHDYRMMRMREMPKVEVVLAPSGGFWGGIGEPGQAAIAPAICNALFAATGKRVRSLPLKSHGVEIALGGDAFSSSCSGLRSGPGQIRCST